MSMKSVKWIVSDYISQMAMTILSISTFSQNFGTYLRHQEVECMTPPPEHGQAIGFMQVE